MAWVLGEEKVRIWSRGKDRVLRPLRILWDNWNKIIWKFQKAFTKTIIERKHSGYKKSGNTRDMELRTHLNQFGHTKHLGSFGNKKILWLSKISYSHVNLLGSYSEILSNFY